MELPKPELIGTVKIKLWDGDDRYYQYQVYTSIDGKNWKLAVDKSKGQWRSWQEDVFNPRLAKYVKVKGLYNSNVVIESVGGGYEWYEWYDYWEVPDEHFHIVEMEVYKHIKRLSPKELDAIPQGPPIEPYKYPSGTVLEDPRGNLYLVQAGSARLIPDKVAFEAMGLKTDSIKRLSNEQLLEIPQGPALEPIKYPNKTLVKGSGNSIYLIMGGHKKYVPSGEILNNVCNELGINPNNIKTISDEELANIPTDDGIPRVDFYPRPEVKKNLLKQFKYCSTVYPSN